MQEKGWSGRELMTERWNAVKDLIGRVENIENECIIELETFVIYSDSVG